MTIYPDKWVNYLWLEKPYSKYLQVTSDTGGSPGQLAPVVVSVVRFYTMYLEIRKKEIRKKRDAVGCCWYGSMAISWISRLYLLSVVVQFFVTVNVVVIVTSTDHGPQIDDG